MPAQKKKIPEIPLDVLDALPSLDVLVNMLEGVRFWPARIEQILEGVGLKVTHIEREEAHPVWLMKLTRTSFALAADQPTAAKQIRKVLVKGGIKIGRGEFNIIDRRGDKLRCVFVLGPSESVDWN